MLAPVKSSLAYPPPVKHGPGKVIPVGLPVAQLQVAGAPCYLMGWSVRNTSQTALAAFSLYNSTIDNIVGTLDVFPVNLYYNESNREWFGPNGVWLNVGCVFNPESGTVAGSVFVAFPHRM